MTRKPSRDATHDAEQRIPTQGATRRGRQRDLTRAQIMAAARALLTPHHSGELSLRAVARAVGIAPSGIYRYFDSREELVEAIASDARASAQAALSDALAPVPAPPPGDPSARSADGTDPRAVHLEQAVTLAHAYRRWCLAHRAEFSLLFAIEHTDPGGLPDARTAVAPFFAAPLQHYLVGIRLGAVDPAAAVLPGAPELSVAAEAMRSAVAPELTARDITALLWVWSTLHGFVSLELLGPLAAFYADPEAAFEEHARAALAAAGYRAAAD